MAQVTKSIGTGVGRDYSTVTAWHADLDSDVIYDAGDIAVGELHNDSVFNEVVTFDKGDTIGLASARITVAAADRHTGIADTGVRWHKTGNSCIILLNEIPLTVEFVEFYAWGSVGGYFYCIEGTLSGNPVIVRNCIFHDEVNTMGGALPSPENANYGGGVFPGTDGAFIIQNNIFYRMQTAVTDYAGTEAHKLLNNTSVDTWYSSYFTFNMGTPSPIVDTINNIALEFDPNDFSAIGFDLCNESAASKNNLSGDDSAPGPGSKMYETQEKEFISCTVGSEDYHLNDGATSEGAGADIGTTNDVNIACDGWDRADFDEDWDIGAAAFTDPIIDSITPAFGTRKGGTPTTIAGHRFVAGMTVVFNNDASASDVVIVDDHTITAVTPEYNAGDYDVNVSDGERPDAVLVEGYEFRRIMQIDTITPDEGTEKGGTSVVVRGDAFDDTDGVDGAKVFFGSTEGTVTDIPSEYEIDVTVPAHAIGLVDIRVLNADLTEVTASDAFTFTDDPAWPVELDSIDPEIGSVVGGTLVTLSGKNFVDGAEVYFGGVESADVTFVDDDEVTAITPAGTVGLVDVRIVNPELDEATLEDAFEYEAMPEPIPKEDVTFARGRNQSGTFNGARLVGDTGVQEIGIYPWVFMEDQTRLNFTFKLNGTLVDDIEIAVQGCLHGGQADPKTLAVANPTNGVTSYLVSGVVYDRVRAVVTKLANAGKGSQVIVSGRR